VSKARAEQPDGVPTPAIGYIRVSMAREEMISPELQRKSIQDWARAHNRSKTSTPPAGTSNARS
jgi:hypothetical protein